MYGATRSRHQYQHEARDVVSSLRRVGRCAESPCAPEQLTRTPRAPSRVSQTSQSTAIRGSARVQPRAALLGCSVRDPATSTIPAAHVARQYQNGSTAAVRVSRTWVRALRRRAGADGGTIRPRLCPGKALSSQCANRPERSDGRRPSRFCRIAEAAMSLSFLDHRLARCHRWHLAEVEVRAHAGV